MTYPQTLEDAKKYSHKFWSKQPIMEMNEIVSRDGIINEQLTVSNNMTKLPSDFEWVQLKLSDHNLLDQVVTFLNLYYTNNNQFTQIHTAEFMKWYYDNDSIMLCVKSSKHNFIVGFICGKVVKTQVNKLVSDFVEVRLLCVHQQLRHKKLVPCMITELTRQFSLLNYNKAIFNTSLYINKPLISTKYYLRPINVDKLIEIGFLKIDSKNNDITPESIKRTLEMSNTNIDKNFKKMEEYHIPMAFELFNMYMNKYNYHPVFTLEEFTHLFYNNKFVETYVFECTDEDDNCYITDFASYYISDLESVKPDSKGKIIKRGTLLYYTCLNTTIYTVIKNILYTGTKNGLDVFCAFNIMQHGELLKEMKFDVYNQETHYYLYNYRVRNMNNNQIGLTIMQ